MDTSLGDMKIVLYDSNAKIGNKALYRAVSGTHNLHEIMNDNGTKLISLAIGKLLFLKLLCFHSRKFIRTLEYPLMENIKTRYTTFT